VPPSNHPEAASWEGPQLSLRDRRKQLTRDQILAAARDAFAEEGYRSATISDIARRAHVGRATFYMHFSGKAEVADEIARSINPVMVGHLRSLADGPPTLVRIERWLAEMVRITRSLAPIPAVVNEAIGYNRDLARTMVDSLGEVAEQLRDDLIGAGYEPRGLDPGQLAALLLATANLTIVMFGPEPELTDDRNLGNLARLWHRVLDPVQGDMPSAPDCRPGSA
jgi:AcrR family transcriptional regulator